MKGVTHNTLYDRACRSGRFINRRPHRRPDLWDTTSRDPDELTTDAGLFSLTNTRSYVGINVWTAPQGSTVVGANASYFVGQRPTNPRLFSVLGRYFSTLAVGGDTPTAPGVAFASDAFVGDGSWGDGRPLMAVFGEPLDAMVQNLGQTDNSYVSVGAPGLQVLSQGFTTGSDSFGYRLQGIGINIEGSDNVNGDAQLPGSPRSVSVAVHADSNGKPGAKLFDLVSSTEYAPGHSFFEAPPGTHLPPGTSYLLVWSHRGGHWHRLQRTSSNSEDTGKLTGSGIEDAYYRGATVASLSVDSGGNALEFAVYTEVKEQSRIPVTLSWLHIPDGAYAGYQFRLLYKTHRGRLPTSGDIEEYNTWVRWEAKQAYSDPIIRGVSKDIKAVVCTAADDARTNTGMTGIGVPVHWLYGGWQDRPTLIADSYADFYSGEWENTEYGAYVTGNSAYFHPSAKVWTGCDAYGDPHPEFPMGATSAMDMVVVGTPNDPDANNAPLGAVLFTTGAAYYKYFVVVDDEKQERLLPLYAITPIFTVVAELEGD